MEDFSAVIRHKYALGHISLSAAVRVMGDNLRVLRTDVATRGGNKMQHTSIHVFSLGFSRSS